MSKQSSLRCILAVTVFGISAYAAPEPARRQWAAKAFQQSATDPYETLSLRDYGVRGDGTDETAKIQAAVSGASAAGRALYWNSGNYTVSSTITFYSNSRFLADCATCVSITNTNDAAWTLEYNSPVSEASYPLRTGIEIDGLTINAKYGIKVNNPWDLHGGTPSFDHQGLVLGIRISDLIFNGKYATVYYPDAGAFACPSDPNCGSGTLPALSELKDFGIGVSLSGVFDSEISHFEIQHAGIGIYLDHSDMNLIEHGRLNLNGRHIHGAGGPAAGTFLGSQNTIRDNDILVNLRAGGIAIYGTHYYRLINNYFEETATSQASDTFVLTDGDQGTLFESNRFDSTFPSTAPVFILNPKFGQQWRYNGWNPAGSAPPVITIRHDYWSAFWPMQIDWRNNQLEFPIPDEPAVLVAEPDPYVLAYNNCFNVGGGVASGFPWTRNEIDTWVLRSSPRIAVFTVPVNGARARTFVFRFTGRSTSSPATRGSYAISYSEPGAGDSILAPGGSHLGITDAVHAQSVDLPYSLPVAARGTGSFRIDVDNGTVELERIEVIPVESSPNQPACPAESRSRSRR